jgi:hypothetical protein
VHYVVRAPGYKPRLFEIWFEDDPVLAALRKAGLPDVPAVYPPWAVEIRPVTRDADGVWHSTRDFGDGPGVAHLVQLACWSIDCTSFRQQPDVEEQKCAGQFPLS